MFLCFVRIKYIYLYIRDILQIKTKHPEIYHQFQKGHFVVHKSLHVFSTMSIDHAHEQVNEHIQGDGGAVA